MSLADPSVGELSVTTSEKFFLSLIEVNNPPSFFTPTPVKLILLSVPTSRV